MLPAALRAQVQETGILLLDPKSDSIQHYLTPDGPVAQLAFTRDGTRLASAGPLGIKLWDPSTGVELMSWAIPDNDPQHLGFDEETNSLVLVCGDRVEIWTVPRPETAVSSDFKRQICSTWCIRKSGMRMARCKLLSQAAPRRPHPKNHAVRHAPSRGPDSRGAFSRCDP